MIGEKQLKGLVINKGEKYFTFLKKIFVAIDNVQKDYNWLITGHECYPRNEKYVKNLSNEWCWMLGEELTEMIENEDFQWIWGVLLAFPKEIPKEKILESRLPKAYGNDRIWVKPISMQHPLAEIEIIAWDSSMTVFLSRNESIIEKLAESNPLAEDLEEYNKY